MPQACCHGSSCKGDIDADKDVEVDVDIGSYFGALQRGFQSQFRYSLMVVTLKIRK